MDIETGQVRSYFPDRGYGFINGLWKQPVFLHASQIPLGWVPEPGDWVTYQLIYDDQGRPQAINVLPVEEDLG